MASLAYQLPCPVCGSPHSRVLDVEREIDLTSSVVVMHTRRRRVCAVCASRFTTLGTERIVGRHKITPVYGGRVSST